VALSGLARQALLVDDAADANTSMSYWSRIFALETDIDIDAAEPA